MKFFSREQGVGSRTPGRGARSDFRLRRSFLVARPIRAFTLLEIMLAIAIFSLVMVAIYSSWMLIVRATKVGREATAQVQRRRIAVRTIENALVCVQSFQASLPYYTFVVQNGDEPLLSFTARLPDDFPRNGRFGDFNVRRVTFTVEPGPNSEEDLVLRQNPILMDMDRDEQEHPLVLARNVKSFTAECWNPTEDDWSDKWDNTNQIPTLVRFTLVLGGNKQDYNFGETGPELSVTRVVAIPSVMVPTAVQSQSAGGGGNLNNLRGQHPPFGSGGSGFP
jgi:prepilin-type N-terminal cleavage/methylation domain-containing protein